MGNVAGDAGIYLHRQVRPMLLYRRYREDGSCVRGQLADLLSGQLFEGSRFQLSRFVQPTTHFRPPQLVGQYPLRKERFPVLIDDVVLNLLGHDWETGAVHHVVHTPQAADYVVYRS